MTGLSAVESLDPSRHRVEGFDCGEPALDRWLKESAGQAQRRDAARTFVVCGPAREVAGYYTLVVGQVEHVEAPSAVRHGLSRHFPIPVCILARLAVSRRWQRQGVGSDLLLDALRRVDRAAEQVGIRAVLVHAVNAEAACFYRAYGFEAATSDGLTLMVPLVAVRRALGP